MPKLPVLKPLEVVSRLQALGFNEVRQRGATSSSAIPIPWSGHHRTISQGPGHLSIALAEDRSGHRDNGRGTGWCGRVNRPEEGEGESHQT